MPYDSCSGYYQDPGGLPGYDAWKLASPYDGPTYEPDDDDGPERWMICFECMDVGYELDGEIAVPCPCCSMAITPEDLETNP